MVRHWVSLTLQPKSCYDIHVSRFPNHSSQLRGLTLSPSFLLALKRTDSSSDSTRRKDSTVSKVSEVTPEARAEDMQGDRAASAAASTVPESPLFDVPGEEDELEEKMPWLKVVARVANGFNFCCTHQGFCHPSCFRRQMRASRRIMVAARRVREDEEGEWGSDVVTPRCCSFFQIYGEEVEYTEDIFSDDHGGHFGIGHHVHHHSGGGRSVDAGGGGGGGGGTGGHDSSESQQHNRIPSRNSGNTKINMTTVVAGESNGTSPDKTKGRASSSSPDLS